MRTRPPQKPDRLPAAHPRATFSIPPISLLWPNPEDARRALPHKAAAESAWEQDLGLGDLAHALSADKRYGPFIRNTLAALVSDAEVILWRQAVLADFVSNPTIAQQIEALLPRFVHLREGSKLLGQKRRNLLLETSDRLAELELYTAVVKALHAALKDAALTAPALIHLRDALHTLQTDPQFQELVAHLPELRAPLENIQSITIAVNLDPELRPASAVLMAINQRQISESASFLDRLIGTRATDADESALAPLHHTPKNPDERLLSPLFQDLDRLLLQVAQPIARALNRYVRVSSAVVMGLESELAFFIAAWRLMQQLGAQGIPFCRPELLPVAACATTIDHLVNINLALRLSQQATARAIPNPVRFDDEGRIALLTGPNSGGKTTYLQSVGLAQAMFQAGLFLPAQHAQLSPVQKILTHFPALETRQQGRLAEEAARLRALFAQLIPDSLVLLNETFSSTSSTEAVYLAQDMLCGLRFIGVRAIFATHLAELAEQIAEIEATVEGRSRVFSLVAGVRLDEDAQAVPTYEITRGQPLGRSYAQEIARRHGISLAQILAARP